MGKYVKTFENFINDGKQIGDYFLTNTDYKKLIDEGYGPDEDEIDNYLNTLNNYYNNGGKIRRIIFSSKVNKNLGHHWTHMNNDIDNYIQDLFDFLHDEGKVTDNPPITIIEAITPPHNVGVKYSLEQYQNNPWEEEIYIKNSKLLKEVKIRKIK
jgi:hypothetical protein